MSRVHGRRGPIPSELGGLIDELASLRDELDELQSLDATVKSSSAPRLAALAEHLAGLTTDVVVGGNKAAFNQPNDGTFTWYPTDAPDLRVAGLVATTGRIMVTVTAGEARLNPFGGKVQGLVGYSVKDANGATVPNSVLGTVQRYGRITTAYQLNLGLQTPEIPLTINPIANPGPYEVRGFVGAFADAVNSGPCSFEFRDISMRVDVLDM